MDLLPSSADEFRSREYWDRFFRKRRGKAFEWYGEWHELKPLLLRPECCGTAHRTGGDTSNESPVQILVVGCGNSELSAHLHDHVALPHAPAGRVPAVITSIDFSTVVIDEMKRKNDAARPNMKWHVMDMTATTVRALRADEEASGGCCHALAHTAVQGRGEEAAAPALPRSAPPLPCSQSPVPSPPFNRPSSTLLPIHSSQSRPLPFPLSPRAPAARVQYEGGAFDVVVDKGGLDALMGEEGGDASTAGARLLHEVQRLVAPGGGRYLCVTLAQSHVLELLLRHFRAATWTVVIHAVPIVPHTAPSPLRPFLVVATNTAPRSPTSSSSPSPAAPLLPLVATTFARVAHSGIHPEQLADIFTLVDRENHIRSAPCMPPPLPAPTVDASSSADAGAAPPSLAALAAYSAGRRVLCRLTPHVPGAAAAAQGEECGEVVVMAPPPDDGTPSPATDSRGGGSSAFSGVVLDATPTMLDGASLPCAVFLVPQGMNRDWLYASEEGQWQLVESANAQRLILVQQNEQPGQLPLTMAQVQEELSPLVRQLAPEYCRKTRYAIPYITTETAAVTGTVRAEVVSAVTGAMVVLDDVRSPPLCTRRLVFRRNPNLVQSEALLVPAPPPAPAAPQEEPRGSAGGGASDGIAKAGGKKGAAGGKQKQGKAAAAAAAADTAAGASKKSKKAAAKAGRKQQAAEEAGGSAAGEWVVEHGQLASEYHGAMLAGLSLLAPLMEARETTNAQLTAAVIGLGGGALPMFLRQHFPFTRITVAELDAVMGQVASDHFGFTQDSVLRLHIGDGVALVQSMAAPHGTQGAHQEALVDHTVAPVQRATAALALSGSSECGGGRQGGAGVDVIFVDADSDDPSTGMSCPAQVFLEPHFLQSARAALNEGGMLVLNVVARASSKYKAAVAAVRQ
ncbi:unnamed protein product, partial [Closterium sp. Naga37s-1]